ncbi:MAG: hypothetical protein LBP26_05185 [Clostridiales bacterium]|jgi:outer membrane lipoprotein-sorting protein|nr:hypothetical protein [Clostridiales bacterium]
MKKFRAIIFLIAAVLLGVAALGGCTDKNVVYEFDSAKPWGGGTALYERCGYDVTLTERVASGKDTVDGRVLAEGKAAFTLEYYENNEDQILLTYEFSLTYSPDPANGADAGLTDTVFSKVRFMTKGCAPVYSEKTQTYAPRKNDALQYSDGVVLKYSDQRSYRTSADYSANKAVVETGRTVNADGEPSSGYSGKKEFALKSGETAFDTDQLFYAVRALTSTKPAGAEKSSGFLGCGSVGGGSDNVTLTASVPYDIAATIDKKGRYKNTPISVLIQTDLVPVKLPEFAAEYLPTPENGEYSVKCLKTSLSINSKTPGPPTVLLITEPDTKFTKNNAVTNKIIYRIERTSYNLAQTAEAARLSLTLTDYATVK